jgi:hypothetical protein
VHHAPCTNGRIRLSDTPSDLREHPPSECGRALRKASLDSALTTGPVSRRLVLLFHASACDELRHLDTGHRQGHMQVAPWLRAHPKGRVFVPGGVNAPGFGAIVMPHDASAVVHACSSSRRTPDPLVPGLSATLTTLALDRRELAVV